MTPKPHNQTSGQLSSSNHTHAPEKWTNNRYGLLFYNFRLDRYTFDAITTRQPVQQKYAKFLVNSDLPILPYRHQPVHRRTIGSFDGRSTSASSDKLNNGSSHGMNETIESSLDRLPDEVHQSSDTPMNQTRLSSVWPPAIQLAAWVTLLFSCLYLTLSLHAQPSPPLNTTPPTPALPSMPSGSTVAVIQLHGDVYDFHLQTLKRHTDEALRQGASLIVLEIDTYGGLVNSALEICKIIKTTPKPTIAWINHKAYSAGILIAAACDHIVMAPSSAAGDCAPIVPGMNLSSTERAKALSPILEEFRDSAARNGYDYALFQAMCVLGVEVYQIRHTHTGQTRLVNQADYAVMVKGQPIDGGLWDKMARSMSNQAANDTTVGQATVQIATEPDRGQWQLASKIHDGKTLLTLNQTRALDVGLARALVSDVADLQNLLSAKQVSLYAPTTLERIAFFLTRDWVRMLLMMVLVVGAYVESLHPGLGLPGGLALIALIILLGAPFLVSLAELWHVVLFLVGVVLLLVELFVIPGFGVIGVTGILCMFTGLVLMGVPSTGQGSLPLPAPEAAPQLRQSVLFAFLAVLGSALCVYTLSKHFGSIPLLRRLVLESTTTQIPLPPGQPLTSAAPHLTPIQIGDVGQAVSPLHPSGQAQFAGQIFDVISEGDWIEAGRRVYVINIHGNQVTVSTHPR